MSTLRFNKWKSVDGVTRNTVLQVVSKNVTTDTTSTSAAFVDATDMFLAITPTSETSKILVSFTVKVAGNRVSSAHFWALQILRNSSVAYAPFVNNGTGNIDTGLSLTGVTNVGSLRLTEKLSFLDSPATTSQITYKLQFCNYVNTSTPSVVINSAGTTSTITLMEIAQ